MNSWKKKRSFGILLAALLWVCRGHSAPSEALLQEENGKLRPFSSLRGHWVFIHYWAQWCEACIQEIPSINHFYQSPHKERIALYAVHFDPLSEKKQKALNAHFKIHYPSLKKDPAQALGLGDIAAVPVTFVFNPQGRLVKTLYGPQNKAHLEAALLNP